LIIFIFTSLYLPYTYFKISKVVAVLPVPGIPEIYKEEADPFEAIPVSKNCQIYSFSLSQQGNLVGSVAN